MINFIQKTQTNMDVKIEFLKAEGGIEIYKFSVDNPKCLNPQPIILNFSVSASGAFSVWNSNCRYDRSLKVDWGMSTIYSRLYTGAPTQQIIAANGTNILNIAILDAAMPVNIKTGIIEETAEILCEIEFFAIPISSFEHYETEIRIDTEKLPYYTVLKNVKTWWTTCGGYTEAMVPDAAKSPVNSLWYSFHQNLDVDRIVEQCTLSADLGIKSVIVDDGWQTDDNNRGYAFCGDWEASDIKIKGGMKSFVKRVHDTGLKFIMWYSVPFVGIHSKAFNKFKGKIINFNGEYGCLDPRYRDVREYLVSIYKNAVLDWDLDGLKLDFIDSFMLPSKDEELADGRDTESVEDAVKSLLSEIKEALCRIKPDFLFEFRQSYTGPIVSSYGNMLRVADCPADGIRNRIGIADIRLLSGSVPAHSDMLMWNINEGVENAALQIVNIIFGVPQISMLIDKLPKKHYAMLKFYLDFWNSNRDILLFGEFVAENPEANYSFISSEKDNKIIAAAYSKNVMTVSKKYDKIILLNGTAKESLIFDF